jgi:hypothetical protein
MLAGIYARFAPIAVSFSFAAAFALAACGGDSQATPDGGANAGPDAGVQCTTTEDCNDADPCTLDRCDSEVGCIHEPADEDRDGYAEGVCITPTLRGGDCNDMNETVYPGAPELCDELDNDCNDAVDDEVADVVCSRDADGDGFGWRTDVVAACNCPAGYIPPRSDAKFDCADGNADRNPGHTQYEYSGYCSGGRICQVEFASYDWDCNGDEEMEFPSMSDGSCRFEGGGGLFVCKGSGWELNVASCGDSGPYRRCSAADACNETIIPSQRQACR